MIMEQNRNPTTPSKEEKVKQPLTEGVVGFLFCSIIINVIKVNTVLLIWQV